MKLKVIKYDGVEERFYDVLSFEFRTNQVTNFVKVKLEDRTVIVSDICVIKTIE